MGLEILEFTKASAQSGEPIVRHLEDMYPHQGYAKISVVAFMHGGASAQPRAWNWPLHISQTKTLARGDTVRRGEAMWPTGIGEFTDPEMRQSYPASFFIRHFVLTAE